MTIRLPRPVFDANPATGGGLGKLPEWDLSDLYTAPDAPEPRVTISARALKSAFSTHVLITGAEKRAALERAQKLPPMEAPVAALLSDATVHWAR